MKNITCYITLLLLLTLSTVSCIRDELVECPPLHLSFIVKDKNYFNVNYVDLENRKSEDLAFREYVPTLHYSLTDIKTGEMVVHSDFIRVTGDEKDYPVDLPSSLPFGTYVIQVWGGLANLDPLEDDHTTLAFHPNNTQGRDIYLTCDTIEYTMTEYDHIVELERTKGKLIIQLENLPEGFEYSEKSIDNLYGGVDNEFNYSDMTEVSTSTEWTGNHVVTKTLLSPTFENEESTLSMVIHDGSLLDDETENNTLNPYNVPLTINRNELTVVRYIWNPILGDFDISMLVNDTWSQIHGMVIGEEE